MKPETLRRLVEASRWMYGVLWNHAILWDSKTNVLTCSQCGLKWKVECAAIHKMGCPMGEATEALCAAEKEIANVDPT